MQYALQYSDVFIIYIQCFIMGDDLLKFFTDIDYKFRPVQIDSNKLVEERGATEHFPSDEEDETEYDEYAKKYEDEESEKLKQVMLAGFYFLSILLLTLTSKLLIPVLLAVSKCTQGAYVWLG